MSFEIVHPDISRPPTGQPEFALSNDFGIGARYAELQQFAELSGRRPDQAGVLIGSGILLSMADVLPPNLYVTDFNSQLLQWTANALHHLGQNQTPANFKQAMQLAPPAEGCDFGNQDILASQKRYDHLRQAMSDKKITYIAMHYGNPAAVKKLGELIKDQDQVVSILNATNTHDYLYLDGFPGTRPSDYFESLESWPWADNYRIMVSAVRTDPLTGQRHDTFSLPLLTSATEYREQTGL